MHEQRMRRANERDLAEKQRKVDAILSHACRSSELFVFETKKAACSELLEGSSISIDSGSKVLIAAKGNLKHKSGEASSVCVCACVCVCIYYAS